MDIRYYKEQHHNYMVICQTEDESAVGYQQKMLAGHRMEYLLPAKSRSVDGCEYNYYDITSRLTLRQMFGSRYLDMFDIRSLMDAVRKACEEVDRYLLDVRRLCMSPDLIFYNYSGNSYSFMYNVSTEVEDSLAGIAEFMDYLLERVSPDDHEAGDLVYRMYEVYEKGGYDVWDAVLIAEESKDDEGAENDRVQQDNCTNEYAADIGAKADHVYDSVYEGLDRIDGPAMSDMTEYREPERKRGRFVHFVLAAAGLTGIVASVLVYLFIYLNEDEIMLLIAGAGASAVAMIAGVVMIIRTRIGVGKEIRDSDSLYSEDEYYMSEHYSSMPAIRMQDFVSDSVAGSKRRKVYSEEAGKYVEDDDISDEGKTVFFDEKSAGGHYKLYALDRKNKQHIDLNTFPCTIGKLAGYVDHCIDHPSVSRMHARVEKHEDRLFLTDLNSTNGIYLNGVRLNPNEQRVIEAGDEIRFGSLNYCLRSVSADQA